MTFCSFSIASGSVAIIETSFACVVGLIFEVDDNRSESTVKGSLVRVLICMGGLGSFSKLATQTAIYWSVLLTKYSVSHEYSFHTLHMNHWQVNLGLLIYLYCSEPV
jgi:hypothetical protein